MKSATAYPKFVLGFFSVITLGIFLFLIPRFEQIFADFGAKLPQITQIFMNISRFLRQNSILIIIALVLLFVGIKFLRRTQRAIMWFDAFILKVPLVGKLALQAAIQRLSITLSTLLSNGIPLTEALETATGTLNNSVLEADAREARAGIIRGRSLAESLSRAEHFPPLLARMVHVGEESGSLSEMLDDIANYYEQEVSHALSRITALVEPVLICGMGVIVLITIIAVYLPIFNLGKTVGGTGGG